MQTGGGVLQSTPAGLAFTLLALAWCAMSPLAGHTQEVQRQLPVRAARDTARVVHGVIEGAVTDTNLVPLAGSEVGILRTALKVRTGENGRFRILGVPAGAYILIVRRLGFRPVSAMVQVPIGDTVRLAYTLERAAVELGTVVISEKRQSLRLLEFEYRRKLGQGEFITQDDIDKRPSVTVADVLRRSKTLEISPSYTKGSFPEYFVVSRRAGDAIHGGCPVQILVDGVEMPSPFDLNLLPPPKEFAAIEIYAGAATVPPQFSGVSRRCGMILFWTKDG